MVVDAHGRSLRALRVSVTDRCNLRCQYCMPEAEYVWLPRDTILHFEEIRSLVEVFVTLGVDKVRLTGGEPLIRRDLPGLVRMLADIRGLDDLALTTNGLLFREQAEALRTAGLGRVTISVDTLRADRFTEMTRMQGHARILESVDAATRLFGQLKIDTVVMRGVNDDELAPLIEFGRLHHAEVRFIEYMDVGGATRWSTDLVVPRSEILERISGRFGEIAPLPATGSAPADRFRLPDGTIFGVVASTTTPFCRDCDRGRLTADGQWLTCLYAERGLDLRTPLRRGASASELRGLLEDTWRARTDRGAEERLAQRDRSVAVPVEVLRRDPHLEMHTRGG